MADAAPFSDASESSVASLLQLEHPVHVKSTLVYYGASRSKIETEPNDTVIRIGKSIVATPARAQHHQQRVESRYQQRRFRLFGHLQDEDEHWKLGLEGKNLANARYFAAQLAAVARLPVLTAVPGHIS